MAADRGGRRAGLFDKDAEPETRRDRGDRAAPGGGPYAGVVFNRPLDAVFTYRVPGELVERLRPGQRVRVPLGRGNTPAVGYCVSLADETEVDPGRVKAVLEILDDPPLIDPSMLDLTRWMARYYVCSWGQALDAAVPAGVKKQAGTRLRNGLLASELGRLDPPRIDGKPLSKKQADALAVLRASAAPLSLGDVCRLADCGPSAVSALKKAGLVETVKERVARATPESDDPLDENGASALFDPDSKPVLTPEQTATLDRLLPALRGDAFAPFLLHGVTGSGKTEVYLGAIEEVVSRGREAIVLVPEISLTPQTIRRFRRRFAKVAVLHSHLSDVERHRHWQSIASGEVGVVVGARSAVFAPARRLGLLVIDEEHESTFKQETTPRYHARDVAVKRASLLGIPVILGSATPSLESWRNADAGRYRRLVMSERVQSRPMPPVSIIDMRHEKPEKGRAPGALSGPLREAMRAALDDDGQIILLLNRRGFHTFIHCPRCGFVLKCDSCDVALTHHKFRQKVVCHTCDAERDPPRDCPDCRGYRLHYGGLGTERLEREVKAEFGDRVARRMDSDTMRSTGSHERVLDDFKQGKIDILLGTQMIAKGLDFPNVTLVGVVNADTSLHLPDFRARERTFQLVAQVAGRTGRGEREGRVLVQTHSPDDHAILCAARHDYHAFVEGEIPERQLRGYPPFGRLARVVARGPDENETRAFLERLRDELLAAAPDSIRMLGPAPAPVMKIRDLFRYHLQIRAPAPKPLQDLLHAVAPRVPPPGDVELAIDVDPVAML